MSKLVIVQCGGSKIWKKNPELGPVEAKDAYTSSYFKLNREYAENFGNEWLILSAKYGFLKPDQEIENYNVTFKEASTNPIPFSDLRKQVEEKGLDRFTRIEVLGGEDYYEAVLAAFDKTECSVESPLRGKDIFERQRLTKQAIESGTELKKLEPDSDTKSSSQQKSTQKNRHDSEYSGKYTPLKKFLEEVPEDRTYITLSFQEIEDEILGFDLPKSASKHSAWWSNGGHNHADAWMSAGWKVDRVALGDEITLEREL